MPRSPAQLRNDALAIWQAGVEAVRSDRLVKDNVRADGEWLVIGDESVQLASIGRIAVVGAGKAGAGMAAGLEEALGPRVLAEKRVSGWINVPADCVRELGAIHVHAARPAGVNEPTAEGVLGAEKILEIVSSLRPNDLCFCLLSGGGSALLPAPVAGVSLAEKQAVTRLLSEGGANIEELNTVRKQLSRIKGGGLARASRAGRLVTLIVSDVLGDPLDVIASGPTVPDSSSPQDALTILERYAGGDERVAPAAFAYLRCRVAVGGAADHGASIPQAVVRSATHGHPCHVTNLIIGNNAVAVDAAGIEAERRGYSHAMVAATSLEGAAEEIGQHLARMALKMQIEPGPDCLITGGEPTVKLASPDIRGKGGRNQQLVLAALVEILNAECGVRIAESGQSTDHARGSVPSTQYSVPSTNVAAVTPHSALRTPHLALALLSGGTDGEDGPTDAAGAFIDAEIIARMRELNLDPADFLRRNDAYCFFDAVGGLIKTGPTHTNVCDVRVVVVDRAEAVSGSGVE